MSTNDKPAFMSAERRAEIRKRANAATPGPWSRNYQGKFMAPDPLWPGEPDMVTGVITASTYPGQEGMIFASDEDAAFVVAARTDVPALLGHIDALTAGAVDADDLGKRLHRYLHTDPVIADREWALLFEDQRDRWSAQAVALYTLGRAAGRIEGEAAPYVCPCCYHQRGDEVPADARSTREQMAAEIARLTAELAAAKGNMR